MVILRVASVDTRGRGSSAGAAPAGDDDGRPGSFVAFLVVLEDSPIAGGRSLPFGPCPSLLLGAAEAGSGGLLASPSALLGFGAPSALSFLPSFARLASATAPSGAFSASCACLTSVTCAPDSCSVACCAWLRACSADAAVAVSASLARSLGVGEPGSALWLLMVLPLPVLLDASGGMPECRREILARSLDFRSPISGSLKMEESRIAALAGRRPSPLEQMPTAAGRNVSAAQRPETSGCILRCRWAGQREA